MTSFLLLNILLFVSSLHGVGNHVFPLHSIALFFSSFLTLSKSHPFRHSFKQPLELSEYLPWLPFLWVTYSHCQPWSFRFSKSSFSLCVQGNYNTNFKYWNVHIMMLRKIVFFFSKRNYEVDCSDSFKIFMQ